VRVRDRSPSSGELQRGKRNRTAPATAAQRTFHGAETLFDFILAMMLVNFCDERACDRCAER